MGKIVLKSVRKSFGEVDVIPGVDLTIDNGDFVVFVGPSGCGKSTLLRLIAGLEDTTSGTIEIDPRNDMHVTERLADLLQRDLSHGALTSPRQTSGRGPIVSG